VLELEAEIARLRDELTRVRNESRQAVQDTHRQYRRDLVPVNQQVVVYGHDRKLFRRDD
jgi:MerR family transcriptional regulator, heat shock protein HspR